MGDRFGQDILCAELTNAEQDNIIQFRADLDIEEDNNGSSYVASRNSDLLLRKIMLNIIFNKGTFKP